MDTQLRLATNRPATPFGAQCDFMSNELFDTDGAVPLEHLEKREWCGGAADHADDESGEGGAVESPVGSTFHINLLPSETLILADWYSRTWGSGSLSGSGSGYADYRIEPCPAGGGDCVHLQRLVIYGGDVEVNRVEASNLIAQLIQPAWLPYDSSLGVDVGAGDLTMLLTYKIGDDRIAWEVTNSDGSGGTIDPLADMFVLDTLEFTATQFDTTVTVELDVGGSHQ